MMAWLALLLLVIPVIGGVAELCPIGDWIQDELQMRGLLRMNEADKRRPRKYSYAGAVKMTKKRV